MSSRIVLGLNQPQPFSCCDGFVEDLCFSALLFENNVGVFLHDTKNSRSGGRNNVERNLRHVRDTIVRGLSRMYPEVGPHVCVFRVLQILHISRSVTFFSLQKQNLTFNARILFLFHEARVDSQNDRRRLTFKRQEETPLLCGLGLHSLVLRLLWFLCHKQPQIAPNKFGQSVSPGGLFPILPSAGRAKERDSISYG